MSIDADVKSPLFEIKFILLDFQPAELCLPQDLTRMAFPLSSAPDFRLSGAGLVPRIEQTALEMVCFRSSCLWALWSNPAVVHQKHQKPSSACSLLPLHQGEAGWLVMVVNHNWKPISDQGCWPWGQSCCWRAASCAFCMLVTSCENEIRLPEGPQMPRTWSYLCHCQVWWIKRFQGQNTE